MLLPQAAKWTSPPALHSQKIEDAFNIRLESSLMVIMSKSIPDG